MEVSIDKQMIFQRAIVERFNKEITNLCIKLIDVNEMKGRKCKSGDLMNIKKES
jgi:hypothetical protein